MMLHGDGSPTRRYLFASDAAEAFDTMFHKGQNSEIYNIGSSDEISNRDLCGHLLDQFGIPKSDWSKGLNIPKIDHLMICDMQWMRPSCVNSVGCNPLLVLSAFLLLFNGIENMENLGGVTFLAVSLTFLL